MGLLSFMFGKHRGPRRSFYPSSARHWWSAGSSLILASSQNSQLLPEYDLKMDFKEMIV